MSDSPIVIPLDGMGRAQAVALAERLLGKVWGFKVNDLLLACGTSIVEELKGLGRVFVDAKLHDIPNTVANGVKRLASAGADLITVHASGGPAMVRAAVEQSGGAGILAVTVLTSLDDVTADEVFGSDAAGAVVRLARMAAGAGAAGIVCSPRELVTVSAMPEMQGRLKVTPGIRPAWHGKADDQRRSMTPAEAITAGADLLVIGRPITGAADPVAAVERVLAEIRGEAD